MICKWIYKLAPKAFNQLVYESLPVEDEFGKMVFAFVCEGKRYYRYVDEFDIPIDRKAAIDEIMTELLMKTDSAELAMFTTAMRKVIEEGIKNGGKFDLLKLGRIVTELEDRKNLLIHVDLFFAIVGATHYAEGEKVHEWNQGYEQQKIEALKRDYAKNGRMYDFFEQAALKRLLPYLPQLKENWNEVAEINEAQRRATNEYLSLLISGTRLSKSEKNG